MFVTVHVLDYTYNNCISTHVSVVGEYIPKNIHSPEGQDMQTTCSHC